MRKSQFFCALVFGAVFNQVAFSQIVASQEALFQLINAEKTAAKKIEKISSLYSIASDRESKSMTLKTALNVIEWGSPLNWAADYIKDGKPCNGLKGFLRAGFAPSIEEEKDLPQELKNSINFMAKICQDYALRK